jgi:hypothetical protein
MLALSPEGFGERGTALAIEPGRQKAIAPASRTTPNNIPRNKISQVLVIHYKL